MSGFPFPFAKTRIEDSSDGCAKSTELKDGCSVKAGTSPSSPLAVIVLSSLRILGYLSGEFSMYNLINQFAQTVVAYPLPASPTAPLQYSMVSSLIAGSGSFCSSS